ncbi:MAG: T9SS type A sorting domain-containing protein [Raineya sp.]|jgi:hypothetical protein|nr:T9SS type A sorting domain-containing protein [Raineya sp.]
MKLFFKLTFITFLLIGVSTFQACANSIIEVVPPNTGKLFENHQISVSNPYPYPANEFVSFSYQILQNNVDAKIALYDVLGNEVASYRLQSEYNKVVIQTSSLRTGVYFYTLTIDGKNMITKKLVVNH